MNGNRATFRIITLSSTADPGPVAVKIRSFLDLPRGWNFGEGEAPDRRTVEAALAIEREAARHWFQTDAFPGPAGEIMVTLYRGDDYFEFGINSDQTITFCHEEGRADREWEEGLSLGQALARIRLLWNRLCRSSASSASATGIPAAGDSTATHSNRSEILPAYQSSTWIAYEEPVTASAAI